MDEKITVVDARMGRGKSTAAIRYMNEHKDAMRFLYVTPFLSEVGRVCDQCDFEQPTDDFTTKSNGLKEKMRSGRNVAATHSLFYLLDEEALELVRSQHYSLIVDESISAFDRVSVTESDVDIILKYLATEDDQGKLTWRDPEYQGLFGEYKAMADAGSLYHHGHSFLSMVSPNLITSFDRVFMLTYLFDGQCEKAYLDFFGLPYEIVGIEEDEEGYFFSDKPDDPPPIDYTRLIRIWDNKKANQPGNGRTALSSGWFLRHGQRSPEITTLRRGMTNFFKNVTGAKTGELIWTTFKEHQDKLVGPHGSYKKNFLHLAARATNEYRDRTAAAYMANRFLDPNVKIFFGTRGCVIDEDKFALAEMLQWIWRSAIRDDKPIDLFIPSKRMRDLLTNWIKTVSKGGAYPK